MIQIAIEAAGVRNAAKANVTPTVSLDSDLTPTPTRAWVSVT